MSDKPHFWWMGRPELHVGFLLGVEDGQLFVDTIRAVPDAEWPTVYGLLAQYLSPSFNGRVPKRQEKTTYVARESERRKRASVR
jgi:hypothetical protein